MIEEIDYYLWSTKSARLCLSPQQRMMLLSS